MGEDKTKVSSLVKGKILDLRPQDVSLVLQQFIYLISQTELKQKLERVRRALQSMRPVLREYWGLPRAQFWLGLEDLMHAARSTQRVDITNPKVRHTLSIAAEIASASERMPEWKRDEVRHRLLSRDPIEPVIVEIQTANHLVLGGSEPHWIAPQRDKKTADISAKFAGFEFEVECKCKTVDAKRLVKRQHFFELCDDVIAKFPMRLGLIACIEVCTPRAMPSTPEWRRETADAVLRLHGGGKTRLADNTQISVILRPELNPTNSNSLQAEVERIARRAGPFVHTAAFAQDASGQSPIVLACWSHTRDEYLKGIEEDLENASDQLSPEIPGRIVCFVPEIRSFAGMESDSGIRTLTLQFLGRKKAKNAFQIDYVSDLDIATESGRRLGLHFLRFSNPGFEGRIPVGLP